MVRPLTPIQKTALIFYLAYAGILLFLTFWNPSKPVILGQLNPNIWELKKGLNDFTGIQSSFEQLWGKALADKGWEREDLLIQADTQLEEESFGKHQVIWANSRSKILLPESVTEQDLVELVAEWEKINQSLKLESMDLKWGYQQELLWLRLGSQLTIDVRDPRKIPVQQLTIMIPSGAALNHKWPGLVPRLPPAVLPPTVEVPKALPAFKSPRVALIIDDVGSVRKAADAMLQVPARLTWSVMPFTRYAAEYIQSARERGFEVMLHLPLEPLDPKNNPGPGVIKRDWTAEKIVGQLKADLDQIPGAVGLNNHMGSAGTADGRLMDILMREIKKRGLYFVDSMTTDLSVGEKVARSHQVKFKKRDVFIDNLPDPDSKKKALRKLIKIALAKGEAIGIGHVRNGTAEAIIEMLPEFEKAGVDLVTVSELFE